MCRGAAGTGSSRATGAEVAPCQQEQHPYWQGRSKGSRAGRVAVARTSQETRWPWKPIAARQLTPRSRVQGRARIRCTVRHGHGCPVAQERNQCLNINTASHDSGPVPAPHTSSSHLSCAPRHQTQGFMAAPCPTCPWVAVSLGQGCASAEILLLNRGIKGGYIQTRIKQKG